MEFPFAAKDNEDVMDARPSAVEVHALSSTLRQSFDLLRTYLSSRLELNEACAAITAVRPSDGASRETAGHGGLDPILGRGHKSFR